MGIEVSNRPAVSGDELGRTVDVEVKRYLCSSISFLLDSGCVLWPSFPGVLVSSTLDSRQDQGLLVLTREPHVLVRAPRTK